MNYLRMELKVCEGCGTLWVRTDATAGVYCRSCAHKLSEFPAPRGRRGVRREKVGSGRMGCASARKTVVAGGAR